MAKIYFEQSYDSFFPNIDRLYKITESVVENGEYKEYDFTPGGTAPEIQRNIPEIEIATRIMDFMGAGTIKFEDGRKFDVPEISLADTCLFDVLATPVVEGNPHEVFAVENQAMIPRSLAEKIGGDVIGLCFSVVEWGGDYIATIGGIYEDYPLNSTITNALYLGMPNIGQFTWDSTENLLGTDRFHSYALLSKNAKPDEVNPKIVKHLKTKIPEEAFILGDYKIWVRPLSGSYSSRSGVRMMSGMLGLLAFIILACSALNYLLIVIAQLSARGKEMAIRKCYGTGRLAIFRIVMGESIMFIIVSIGLALLLSFCFTDLSKELLGYATKDLFSTRNVWLVEAAVCVVLLGITGVVPALIYSRTPVSQAFRPSVHGRKIWKLILLALQFMATGMVMCLLVLVGRQYKMVGNLNPGIEYENIAIFNRFPLSKEHTATIIKELEKLPFVEGVATSDRDIVFPATGNNLWVEGMEENQVNIADMENINPELFNILDIDFLQGGNFTENADSTLHEVVVEKSMIGVLQKYFSVADEDIVGKTFYITGHWQENIGTPLFTVVGVIDNIRHGDYEADRFDSRAMVYFPSKSVCSFVYVRFSNLTPENLNEAQKVIDSLNDGDAKYILPYKATIESKRNSIKKFGISVMVVGIAIILIALIGLIGYVADEVNRRAKEIAIRKVNGTDAWKIVRLFCIDVLKVALPSLILGGVAAMIIGQRWLSQFTDRVSLSPISMIACLLILLILIMIVVVINTLRVARSNPIDHLRSE